MKILLIAGDANDIFITNMTKWLKSSMPGVEIDIFSFFLNSNQCQNTYCDNSSYANTNVWHQKIPVFRNLVSPYYYSNELQKFLKGKYYDIIQCHWIVPPLVVTQGIHDHCDRLFVTFWGREYRNFKILGSQKLYKKYLDDFMKYVDVDINAIELSSIIRNLYPHLNIKYLEGYLGASSLDYLYDIMKNCSKCEVKEYYNIPADKVSVLIGYSGKSLHQHLKIIKELKNRDYLKNKLHLLAPMTRGADSKYCNIVEESLKDSGYTYTVIKNRFLTDEEIAKLRYSTDILLQLSTTDAFSRSVVECLCAKSVMIYGEWLNYTDYLSHENFEAISVTSITNGIDKLEYVIEHLNEYDTCCEQNSVNGKARNLWSECIKDWVNAYITTK